MIDDMGDNVLKVLAVNDPAVNVYVTPDYHILADFDEKVQFDVVPWAEYSSKMMRALEGIEDYDVVMVAGHLWLCDLAEKGYLAAIEPIEDDILPTIRQEMIYKEQTYLSPSFCDGHMIIYRKDLLEKVLQTQWGPVIEPMEYIDAAKKMSSQLGIPAVAMKAHPSEIFTDALPFLRMNGVDVYDPVTFQACCEKKEIIDGLEQYCHLKKYAIKGTERYGNEEIAYAVKAKKSAMAVTWSGQIGMIYQADCRDKKNLGFSTFRTAWNVSWAFAVNARSTQIDKAKRLLKYLRSSHVDAVAGGYSGAPVRKESYAKRKREFPWYACQLNMIQAAKALPAMPHAQAKHAIMYAEIAKAFAGEKTAADAMRDAARAIDRIEKK